MRLEDQAGGGRRFADDLGKLGGRRRRDVDAAKTFGEGEQGRNFGGAMPEIGAQRDYHPDMARARQAAEQRDELIAIFDADVGDGEQFLQLVDDQRQLRFFVSEQLALGAAGLTSAAEDVAEGVAGIVRRAAQMRRQLVRVLARLHQFRQADAFLPAVADQRLARPRNGSAPPAPARNTTRRTNAAPVMRCGFIRRGITAALTSDDLPEPLAPDTNRNAVPAAAFAASCSVALVICASRPKKIGACSNS